MRIENLQNDNRKFIKSIGNFHVLEYMQDASVSPMNAMNEYFMSKMNVRRRQVVIDIDKNHSAIIQAGAMQWMGGHVEATSVRRQGNRRFVRKGHQRGRDKGNSREA